MTRLRPALLHTLGTQTPRKASDPTRGSLADSQSLRQKPDATNVAGIRTWNSLGRFVKRGEKGILMLAPMVGKNRKQKEEAEQADDAKEPESKLFGFRLSINPVSAREEQMTAVNF